MHPTLIIGAGVSGLCLAFHLYKRNIPFSVMDNDQNHSSKVAAGIINPLVFRRMNKSWMVDEELIEAKQVYQEMESLFGIAFFRDLPFRRVFASEEESHWWNKRLDEEPEFKNYLNEITTEDDQFLETFNEYGTGRISEAFAIDTQNFIQFGKAWLVAIGVLKTEHFEYKNIDFDNNLYANKPFQNIVFCEGYQNLNNPFFSYLPIDPTKGEVLDVKLSKLTTGELLNRKCWIMPQVNNASISDLYRLGATYQWETTDLSPSQEAKDDLIMKAKSLIKCDIEVLNQRTGIRPTTPDRRPIIGAHPKHGNLFILNGMGTKGYCHAPYWSKHLANHIFDGTPLHKEVKIDRFKKKFYKEG